MTPEIQIAERRIGENHPTFIIAELSANHLQNYDKAVALVHAAKEAGADAVKLQTYTPETMTLDLPRPMFQASSKLWRGRQLFDLYREAMTPWEWHRPLKDLAESLGMVLFSSPFDQSAVDFLYELGVPVWKIASFELVDLPLIRACASTGLPMIMSTGMATLEEIDEAVAAARTAGCKELALLKCTSSYPARFDEMNLRTIPDLAQRYRVPVGLSDHSPGSAIPVAAVSLGARLIEKHIILARSDGGPDAPFSLEPSEFKHLVSDVRAAEAAFGTVHYGVMPNEAPARNGRRSIFVVEDIKAGETLTSKNLRCIRPANGLHSRHLNELFGKKAATDLELGTPLQWDHVAQD